MAKKAKPPRKLPPKYRFFLNHYQEYRFTRCPQCDRSMKVRKHPFLINVDPLHLILLNMSGRYCTRCDLLILHQDKVEELLVAAMLPHSPDLIGSDYLVLGTVARKAWRESQKQAHGGQTALANLHEFKEVVLIEVIEPGWGPAAD